MLKEVQKPEGQRAIVVGAGINGLVLAKELLSRGWKVTVCDQGAIPNANAASHGKHRLLHPWSHPSSRPSKKGGGDALSRWKTILSDIRFDGLYNEGVVVVNQTEADSVRSSDLDETAIELNRDRAVQLMPQLANGNFFNINFFNITVYPEYGCLLADQILKHLVVFLTEKGARFLPDFQVDHINPHLASVTNAAGETVLGDKIFVAAGTGTSLLAKQLDIGCRGQAMRCYVLYVEDKTANTGPLGSACWASLGIDDDLWGMPSVRGIPAKLGCGDLTHPCEPGERLGSPDQITEAIVQSYRDKYPRFFSGHETFRLGFNHWTKFETAEKIHEVDKVIFTAACSGVGFKFAPLTATEICDHVAV